MKAIKPQWTWLGYLACAIILILMVISEWGCASSKHKQSSYIKSDSTVTVKETKDSAAKKDSVAVSKSESADDNTIVITFDTCVRVSADDYFYLSNTGEIRTSKVPARVIIKNIKQAVKTDSIALKVDLLENHIKITEADVQEQKETSKAKHSFNLLWLLWLLLIPVVVWLWKNKSKIWSLLCALFERFKKLL